MVASKILPICKWISLNLTGIIKNYAQIMQKEEWKDKINKIFQLRKVITTISIQLVIQTELPKIINISNKKIPKTFVIQIDISRKNWIIENSRLILYCQGSDQTLRSASLFNQNILILNLVKQLHKVILLASLSFSIQIKFKKRVLIVNMWVIWEINQLIYLF